MEMQKPDFTLKAIGILEDRGEQAVQRVGGGKFEEEDQGVGRCHFHLRGNFCGKGEEALGNVGC